MVMYRVLQKNGKVFNRAQNVAIVLYFITSSSIMYFWQFPSLPRCVLPLFWQTNIKLDWTICVIVNRNNFALTNVFCVYFERSMQHWCVLCVAVSFYLLNFHCFCYICVLCFWSCLYVCLCVYLCVCIYVSVSRITAKTNYRFHWNLLLWIGLPYGLTFDDGPVPDTDSVSHFHFHQHCRKEISWFVSISHTVTGRLSRNSAKWLTPIRELVNKILGWIWWTPESRSI